MALDVDPRLVYLKESIEKALEYSGLFDRYHPVEYFDAAGDGLDTVQIDHGSLMVSIEGEEYVVYARVEYPATRWDPPDVDYHERARVKDAHNATRALLDAIMADVMDAVADHFLEKDLKT